MTDRKQLIVVLPGIGGSVLARPGGPDDVVWTPARATSRAWSSGPTG